MTHKEWVKLTPYQQRIKFAQLCGWVGKPGRDIGGPCCLFADNVTYWSPDGETRWQDEPPLITLDTVHEAEKLLNGVQFELYSSYLWDCSSGASPGGRRLISATADQRAAALVLTLGVP
jgi:hypothetical protein